MDNVTFSKSLQKKYRLGKHHAPKLRLIALALTLGEVIVGYICFRRADWMGAYAMGAYLTKEHVIARLTGGE